MLDISEDGSIQKYSDYSTDTFTPEEAKFPPKGIQIE